LTREKWWWFDPSEGNPNHMSYDMQGRKNVQKCGRKDLVAALLEEKC
jgi:hypothetical protein